MSYLYYLVLLIILQCQIFKQATNQANGQLVVPLASNTPSYSRTCPGAVEEILQQIRSNILREVDNIYNVIVPECGDGLWYRVAYLNMIDPSQQCPPAWREYNTSGVRACGRPVSNNCPSTLYPTNQQYSRVCGRVIGYQVGTPDGFMPFHTMSATVDQGYMDGVSITHGEPQRHHIWSYVAGHSQENLFHRVGNCPCSPEKGSSPPLWIGRNYYCESGNPTDSVSLSLFYGSDLLWDGEQCEGTCCSGSKSPPWFSVQLPTHTTDRIEVRICADQPTSDEDVLVELLEIYVQ